MIDTKACLSRHPHPEIDLDKWQKTVNLMADLYDSACGVIVQYRQNEFNAVMASNNESNFLKRDESWPWDMHSFCRRIMETGEGLYVEDAINSTEWQTAPPVSEGVVRSYLGMPIYWPDQSLFGTICVIDTQSTDYNHTFQQLLSQFRDLISSDLQLIFNYEEMKALAITDPLTGVNNRRGLMILGEQRLKDAKRFEQNIGLLYFDIDNLKKVNDEYGHNHGDEAICLLSGILEKNCRETDVIARLGGDEFVVLQLTNDYEHLVATGEKVVADYQSSAVKDKALSVSGVSYGSRYYNFDKTFSLETMISQVDKNMYENKRASKSD